VVVVVALSAVGEALTVKVACASSAARVTTSEYVCVVVPSCAVTMVLIVFAPTLNVTPLLALPDVTAVPLTVMVALAWVTVGVTVMLEVALVTDAV